MNKDIIIPVACSALIFISSLLLYIDFTGKIEHAGADEIGTITFKKKVAERKYSGEVIWEDLEQSVPVYNNDSIRTAEDSISIIKFKDKSEIEINENTFILLTWTDEGATVDFSKGTISARAVDSPVSKLKIVSAGVAVNVQKGNVQLSKVSDKKMSVNVTSGTAVVENQKGINTVTEDKSAVISREKTEIKKKSIRLEYPEPDSYFVTFSGTEEISFRWKADSDDEIYFEAYADSGLTEKVTAKRAADSSIKSGFKPGTYYWRVAAGIGGKAASEARRIVVLKDAPLQPLAPAEGKIFTAIQENPVIAFQWTESAYAASYEVIIADDPEMKNVVRTLKSRSAGISTEKLSFGTYYWAVKNIYSFGKTEAAKNIFIRKFIISREKIIPAPELLSPAENESISYVKLINENVVISWTSNDEINRYELIVSKDRAGKDAALKAETENNFYKVSRKFPPGRYYLTVTGILSGGVRTRPSNERQFIISEARKIITLSPADGAEVDLYEGRKLCFKWDDENNGERYLFEMACDKNFQNILFREYSDGRETCTGAEIKGTFYWRASLVDSENRVLVSSSISRAKITADLNDPEILSPADNQVIDMTVRDSLSFSWKKVEGANGYHVKIFQSAAGFNKQIFEKDTDDEKISFTRMDLLDKGNFYWEIQALYISDKKIMKKSRAAKSNFSLKLEEPLKAPDIISSDILYIK